MYLRIVFLVLSGSLFFAGCASEQVCPKIAPQVGTAGTGSPPLPASPSASAPTDPARDAETHAKYSGALGDGPRSALDPSSPSKAIPTPAPAVEVHTDVGVDAAIKLVATQVPQGHLSKESLESPLKDATRYERCSIPATTRVAIRVAVYDGQAIGVDVRTNPNTPALDFCVDRVVRQTTWIKELAINRVNLTL